MKIYLVRHGETDWNKEKRIQGRSDIALNEYGMYLARKTGEGLRDIPFSRCYTSPLIRAYETARIILRGQDIPIIKDDRIVEMAFGEFEGLCLVERKNRAPESFHNFTEHPEEFVPAIGGETFLEIRNRTCNFLKELIENPKLQNEHILITTHGAALAAMVNVIKKEPLSKFWGTGVSKNCGVTLLEALGQQVRIISENVIYYKEEQHV